MATIDKVRELEQQGRAPIGWDGQTLFFAKPVSNRRVVSAL